MTRRCATALAAVFLLGGCATEPVATCASINPNGQIVYFACSQEGLPS